MATLGSYGNGELASRSGSDVAGPQTGVWQASASQFNSTNIVYYKMQGYCSVGGWETWINTTGDDTNRPACGGVQQASTRITQWTVSIGG